MFRTHVVAALALALTLLAIAGCGLTDRIAAQQVVAKEFALKGTPQVVVETFNGKIEVTVGTANHVRAEVTKKARANTQQEAAADLENIDVAMAQEGDRIHIHARVLDEDTARRSADVVLEVPKDTTLDLKSTNGKTVVTGLAGDVSAETSNGGIDIKGARGKLHAKTTNGPIEIDGGAGRIEAKTTNGTVRLKTGKAVIAARSVNGSIHLAGILGEGESDLTTSNGSVYVTLPAATQFRLNAETNFGGVRNHFPMSETVEDTKNHVSGTIGKAPSITLKIQTTNGRIEIKPQGEKAD